MKKIQIGNATLYHGDTLEVLPTLQPVDLICTDPPYKLTSGGGTPSDGRRMAGCFNNDEYNNNGNLVDCAIDWPDFMKPCFDVLRDPGHAYFMANNRHIANCENAAVAAGFHLHNWLVWDKITATPNRWYMKNLEFIGFFSKGRAFYINDCSAKQLIRCPQRDESGEFDAKGKPHPTEKPVALMKSYIVNSTKPGAAVLDPFMGSGSTGIAALQSGRAFVGIEKDERFFRMAVARMEKEVSAKQGAFC